jgi:transcriptional regulator with XRE-family HTH domain
MDILSLNCYTEREKGGIHMTLGEKIYQYRTQKNLSQGDLADALNVSRQSISKWENDNSVPELDKLVKMAEIFGVTLDALVGMIVSFLLGALSVVFNIWALVYWLGKQDA